MISEFDPKISTYSVIAGQPITRPASPSEVEGYDFSGWFADEGRTTPYIFGSPATSDVTIYAKWTRKAGSGTYNIHFSKNQPVIYGETISIYGLMNPQKATVGVAIKLTPNAYYNNQVEFIGWSKTAKPVSTGTASQAKEHRD